MSNTQHAPIRPTWWNRNKGFILGTVAVSSFAVAVISKKEHKKKNRFLADRGLLNEYYNSDN